MAVDVSRIPNNNKFDPVREAILQLQSDVTSGVAGVGSINGQDGLITITGGDNIGVSTVGTTITVGLDSSIDLTNITLSGYLRGPATFVIDPAAHGDDTGTVVIAGNLQVDGTTTTINSTTVTIDDKNIVLASGAPNATAADGAGITIDGASATMTYNSTSDRFVFNKDIEADLVGNVTGDVTGNLTGDVTGDVTGNVTGDLTGNVTGDVTGDLTGNADTATNADQVDGKHAEQFTLDYVTGNPSGNTTDNKITLGGGLHVNTSTNTKPLEISRIGGTLTQLVKIGVTDTTTDFKYIEDTTSEGNGNFGSYRFILGGNDGETDIVALQIYKDNLDISGSIDVGGDIDVGGSTVISSTRSLYVISANVKGSLNLTTPGAELQVGGVEVIDASRNITAASLATDSITGGTINVNASTRLNLQHNGSTKAYVDSTGFNIIDAALDLSSVAGISLQDESSSIDSYFHANVNYDAGLYQVDSNARYGADYIQIDGNDTRANTVFAISPKDTTTTNPDLFLGGDNAVTSPNTLTDWRNIKMNATSVKINGNEVATQTWVNNTLSAYDLQDVTDNGATTTNGITVANMLISATAPLLDFVDTNSFTDANDRFRIRAAGDVGQIRWYDDSASTDTVLVTFNPNGDVSILGTISGDGSGLTKVFNAKSELGSAEDLDNFRATGYMSQNSNSQAAAGTNYPTSFAGILEVINDDTGNGLHTVQRYSRYSSNDVYTRYYYNGGWQSWTRFLTTSDEGSGNGLDADTVDGLHATSFLRSDADDTGTGNITLSKGTPTLRLHDTGTSSPNYPQIRFTTANTQGVKFQHNVFDSELPTAGYGLILTGDDDNNQFPTTGTLSLTVHGEIYAGGTTNSTVQKVFHDGYHPNADKWTSARTITLGGDLTGNVSIDGSSNVTLSAQVVNDSHTHDSRYYTEGETDSIVAQALGWVPAYNNADVNTVQWNDSEQAVRLYSTTDSSIGMAYKAIRVKAGDKVRFTVMAKSAFAATSGFYVRLYQHNGDLPDGKTHVSNDASYTYVQEDDSGDAGWYDNQPIGTSWVNIERLYTAPADGYVSLVILNWTGIGTGAIYVKQPDIQFEKVNQATSADSATNATNATNAANADTVDGLHATQFLRSDANDTTTGYLRVTGASTNTTGVILGTYTGGTSLSASEVVLGSGGKTGWGVGDEFGAIRWYNTDGSGIGARDAVKIVAWNNQGNGTSTTTFDGNLSFYTSGYNASSVENLRLTDNGHLVLPNGNLGIGISAGTTPSHDLTVSGNAYISGSGDYTLKLARISGKPNIKAETDDGGYLIMDSNGGYAALNWYTSNHVALAVGGGNVGIGTSTVPQKLSVNGNAKIDYSLLGRGMRSANRGELHLNATGATDVSEIFFGYGDGFVNDNNIRWGISDRGTTSGLLNFYVGPAVHSSGAFTTAMTLNASGYLGLNQTAPLYPLDVTGRARITDDLFLGHIIYHNGDTNTYMEMLGDRIRFYCGGVQMIDMVEGTTDYIDFANNTARITSGGSFETTGDIIAYTTTSLSDKNQKENIKKIDSPIDKIKKINGYTFDWKHNQASSGGVIAQEVEKVLPEIVKERSIMDSEPHKTVEYNGLIGLLIETVKEQQKQIDELKVKLDGSTN